MERGPTFYIVIIIIIIVIAWLSQQSYFNSYGQQFSDWMTGQTGGYQEKASDLITPYLPSQNNGGGATEEGVGE